MTLVTLQQLEKQRPPIKYKKLCDLMIAEAEFTVRYNWSDIAIHDRRKIDSAPLNHYFVWILSEFGSYLSPLWCNLAAKDRWQVSPLAPIQILCMRWLNSEDPLAGNRHYDFHIGPHYQKCFIVVKTGDCGAGHIFPYTFNDIVDLCLLGDFVK